MGIRLRESLRGITLATLLVAGATAGVACGGDDDNAASSSSSSGGQPDTGAASSSSGGSDGGPGSSSGGPDANPDVAPQPAVATPTFTPPAGTYTSAQSVVIASASPTTPSPTIYYTTDGTNPTTASVVYSSPIAISQTTTIRAMAAAPGFQNSQVASATYTINIPKGITKPVSFNPNSGTYNNPVAVGLGTQTEPSTICYTIDGTNPTCNAGTCTGTAATYSAGSPIPADAPVGGGNLTIKALACSPGNNNSDPTTAVFGFKAKDPTADPTAPREFTAAANTVTLSTETATSGSNAVTLRYTTGSTDPTCISGTLINGRAGNVNVTQNTTYRVIACRPNYASSAVVSFAYTVKLTTPVTLTPAPGNYNDDTQVSASAGAAPAATTLCYNTGATPPVCNATKDDCTTGSTTPPTVGSTPTTVRVVGCRPNFTDSAELSGTYTLSVAPVAINGSGSNVVSPYDPTLTGNFWNGGSTVDLNLQTGTPGETIRYSLATGNALPAPPDVTCGQVCANDNSCRTCTPGVGGCTGGALSGIPAFTTVKAIGCKANYSSSPLRTIVYADPTNTVVLDPIDPPTGTYYNDVVISMTATAGANICYTQGIGTPADPTCDVVSGACTGGSTYNSASKPVATQTGWHVKAIACKSGVPAPSSRQEAIYTLKVSPPTYAPMGSQVYVGQTVTFGRAPAGTPPLPTAGADFRFTAAANVAADPSCADAVAPNSFVYPFGIKIQTKLLSCKPGYQPSVIATQDWTPVLSPPVITPSGNPVAGFFINQQQVTLSSDSAGVGATQCYTTNGGDPSCNVGTGACTGTGNVTQYSGPFTLSVDGTRVKAVTCGAGFNASAPAQADFNFHVDPYTVTPDPGVKSGAVSVQFTNGNTNDVAGDPPNMRICYTAGANPVDISSTCTAPGIVCNDNTAAGFNWSPAALQNLGASITVKSRACYDGFVPTTQRTDTYTFQAYNGPTPPIVINNTSEFNSSENAFIVGDAAGAATVASNFFYVSWTTTDIYVGYIGDKIANDSDRYLQFYIKGGAAESTGTRDMLPGPVDVFGDGTGTYDPTLAEGANWHFYFRTDAAAPGAPNENVRVYSGGQWGFPVTAPDYQMAVGGLPGTGTAFVEYRISRASLGLTGANTLRIMGSIYDGSTPAQSSRFPINGAGAQRVLRADMANANYPTFGLYVQNP